MTNSSTINVNLFNGNRQPWNGPEVRLILFNPFDNSSKRKLADVVIRKGKNRINLHDVPADAGQRYILSVSADSNYRDHHVFPIKPDPDADTPINVMLIPKDPIADFSKFSYDELKLKSPKYHAALSKNVSEKDFFDLPKTDPKYGVARMAALLNIEAKLRETSLKTDTGVDYVRQFESLSSLEPDRIKVKVAADMFNNVKGLKTFTELNEELNEMNHKGFPRSFKQKVVFCSLQLSFAKNALNGLLDADIDIDMLTDIGHFGEFVKNKVTRTKTDQFNIYALLFDQEIRPLYRLKP